MRQPDAPFFCWDGWIDGVDVLEGTSYVLASLGDNAIKRFDATGAFLGQVSPPVTGSGLACRVGG